MRRRLHVFLSGLVVATFAATAGAMPSGEATKLAPGAHPLDCAKAQDKARCADLNKKIKACKNKTDDEWRECMERPAPAAAFAPPKPRDCGKARDKEACEAHAQALKTCKEKSTRAEHRKCLEAQLQVPTSEKK